MRGVGKSYRNYRSQWGRIRGWVTGTPRGFTDHWVLRDVSLTLQPGQSLGIVGRNGAGKSTLLKIVAGVLTPTEGEVVVRGRVSALLELGMGFNTELTGRQNVVHASGLLGREPAEIAALLPSIEEFADVGEYFDQPMRVYSSGMFARVAFAVATATRPEILIVDEALSVGDAAFQRKSFRRIEEFLEDGTSLLFVSHGTETVKRVCESALWLDRGGVRMLGSAKDTCEAYEQETLTGQVAAPPAGAAAVGAIEDARLATGIEVQYGDMAAEISEVAITTDRDVRANTFPSGQRIALAYRVLFREDCSDVHFGMMIKTLDGICVYASNTSQLHPGATFARGTVVQVRFVLENNLLPGIYYLNCGVNRQTESGRTLLHRRVDTAALRILADPACPDYGLSHLRARGTITVLASGEPG